MLINVVISAALSWPKEDPGELVRQLTEACEKAGLTQLRSISWAPVRELQP